MLDILLASISYQPIQRWGPVSPHGVGTAAGFLLGAILMARQAEPRGIPRQEVYNAVTWGAVGAIIGARGFYVLAHLDQFSSIVDVVSVWQGGLTMFGGFVGGLVLGLGYMWRQGIDIGHTIDAAAPGFVVGVACGRIGDIIIADHLGTRTDFFLGYQIPEGWNAAPGYGPPTYVPGAIVHHTALYDLLGVAVLAGALALVARREPPKGTLFAFFSVWYGLQRFAIDFTRNRELIESSFFGLSGSQWAGLGFALGGTVLLIWIALRRRRHPEMEGELEPAPVGTEPADTVRSSSESLTAESAAPGIPEPEADVPEPAPDQPAPGIPEPATGTSAPASAVTPEQTDDAPEPPPAAAPEPPTPDAPEPQADVSPPAEAEKPAPPTTPPIEAPPTPEAAPRPEAPQPSEGIPPVHEEISTGEPPQDEESSSPPVPPTPENPAQEEDEGPVSDA